MEHPFHVVKDLFRHRKVRYKGMVKNEAQLCTLFGLANRVIAKRPLWASKPEVRLDGEDRPRKGPQTPILIVQPQQYRGRICLIPTSADL